MSLQQRTNASKLKRGPKAREKYSNPPPEALDLRPDFSLWDFEGKAHVDLGGGPESGDLTPTEARAVAFWLIKWANWKDIQDA
jgi:hypothetical protein